VSPTEEISRIAPLIAVAKIRDVRLVEVQAKARVRNPADVPEDASFEIAYGAHLGQAPSPEGIFSIHATIDVRLDTPEPRAEGPFVAVNGVFELRYRLPEGFSATDEELNAFGTMNAVFNAWPYFREFVDSMVTRMDLPTVTLPLYRIPRPQPEPAQIAEGSTDKASAAGPSKAKRKAGRSTSKR
jgi:hypothetical protein